LSIQILQLACLLGVPISSSRLPLGQALPSALRMGYHFVHGWTAERFPDA
jgi:hypothetical protein